MLRGRIGAGAMSLPMLSKVSAQVMEITRDPEADLSELGDLIHRDPSLASHVLRISNSAAYASAVRIVSLQQAVTRLGMRVLCEIALSVAVRNEVFRVKGHEKRLDGMWRHSLASGLWAREIARQKRLNVEILFLCGLLHAIGKPVVLQWAVDLCAELSIADSEPVIPELIDEFHADTGALIAARWNLPEPVQACCRHYRDLDGAGGHRVEVAVTSAATGFADWMVAGYPEAGPELDDAVVQEVNLYPEDRELLLNQRETIDDATRAMAMDS